MILKSYGKREHPCFVPNLSEKTSSFSLLSLMLVVTFFVGFFNQVEKVPFLLLVY